MGFFCKTRGGRYNLPPPAEVILNGRPELFAPVYLHVSPSKRYPLHAIL